jgi:hypothetical protein
MHPEFQEVVDLIEDYLRHAGSELQALLSRHPEWEVTEDARAATLNRMISVGNCAHLALALSGRYLTSPEWWITELGISHTEENRKAYTVEFVQFAKIGFLQSTFSCMESGLRIILREIDSTACNNATSAFKSVYDCLLKSKLSAEPPNAVDLLDLYRNIRNTAHNNGVYFRRTGSDETVTYKGNHYEFRSGQALDFVDWDDVVYLTKDAASLVRIIMDDPVVAALSSPVVDPYAA